jgi:23S rRNA-/tRNA-specific pseudouridylate synthase
LAGDRLYQTSKERQRDRTGLKRHFLHATRLEVPLPLPESPAVFESPLPSELMSLLERLREERRPSDL